MRVMVSAKRMRIGLRAVSAARFDGGGRGLATTAPPQTIISLSVHTAECPYRGTGASTMLVDNHLLPIGSYPAPVFIGSMPFHPPHTIISTPVQIAVKRLRASGARALLVAVQLSVLRLYLPPVLK